MRKVVKGAGMTVEKIILYDTPEDFEAFAASFGDGKNIFENRVAGIEAWARAELVHLGYTDADLDALRFNDPRFDGDSLPDRVGNYAAKALVFVSFVRKAITNNNAPQAARFAVDVGDIFRRVQAAIEWEKFALRGKKIAVLEQQGAESPAKLVRRELVRRHVTREKSDPAVLHWKDDRGVNQRTTEKQFTSRLSALRPLVR